MFKFIKNWLNRLADENKKTFGTGRMDCCEINKPKNTERQTTTNNTIKK